MPTSKLPRRRLPRPRNRRWRRNEMAVAAVDNGSVDIPRGLTYVASLENGIRRQRVGDTFQYFAASGRRVTNEKELARIAALAIPPAYEDVRISPDPNSHLQATGRDTRGRKQYRYHSVWSEHRGETK